MSDWWRFPSWCHTTKHILPNQHMPSNFGESVLTGQELPLFTAHARLQPDAGFPGQGKWSNGEQSVRYTELSLQGQELDFYDPCGSHPSHYILWFYSASMQKSGAWPWVPSCPDKYSCTHNISVFSHEYMIMVCCQKVKAGNRHQQKPSAFTTGVMSDIPLYLQTPKQENNGHPTGPL